MLRTVRPRALWLLWLAATIQAVQYYVHPLRTLAERIGVPLLAVVFTIVFVWLAVNFGNRPRPVQLAAGIVLFGALLNAVVIGVNGRMPYSVYAAAAAGMSSRVVTPKNEPTGPGTRLAGFGDVIPVPPLRKIISPGDLLIAFGTALMLGTAMRQGAAQTPNDNQQREEVMVND